jgi:hypothetical protein
LHEPPNCPLDRERRQEEEQRKVELAWIELAAHHAAVWGVSQIGQALRTLPRPAQAMMTEERWAEVEGKDAVEQERRVDSSPATFAAKVVRVEPVPLSLVVMVDPRRPMFFDGSGPSRSPAPPGRTDCENQRKRRDCDWDEKESDCTTEDWQQRQGREKEQDDTEQEAAELTVTTPRATSRQGCPDDEE